jgi:toluene monooxygenase system protein E
MREAVEKLLVAYDWGEAFTALNLAVKPAFDLLCDVEHAELGRHNDDHLLALTLDQFALDSERSRDWSKALVAYAVAQRPENKEVLKGWVDKWTPLAHRGVAALAGLFGPAPHPADAAAVAARVERSHKEFLAACGL